MSVKDSWTETDRVKEEWEEEGWRTGVAGARWQPTQ